jgi:transcriptional repressor NrdR
MRCPYCRSPRTRVIDTSHDARGGVRRRRVCQDCPNRFSTYERAILATPLVIKQDGSREEFDREKLASGIRISCAKRPVTAANIDRLVGEVEATLQTLGKAEVSSRVIGDMVMTGLKELDHLRPLRHRIPRLATADPGRDRPAARGLIGARLPTEAAVVSTAPAGPVGPRTERGPPGGVCCRDLRKFGGQAMLSTTRTDVRVSDPGARVSRPPRPEGLPSVAPTRTRGRSWSSATCGAARRQPVETIEMFWRGLTVRA